MSGPAIPTPAQIRRMPVTSVAELRTALTKAGLVVKPGGTHQRVETDTGTYIGTLPYTPSDHRNLLNTRSDLARRVGEIRNARRTDHQERS